MTVHDAIGWFQSKLLVNDRFNLHGNQDEAARLALIALIEQEERLQNRPLTLEELREMDGEPVWISGEGIGCYDVFCGISSDGMAQFYKPALPVDSYGKTWLAYRRKPEEGGHGTAD